LHGVVPRGAAKRGQGVVPTGAAKRDRGTCSFSFLTALAIVLFASPVPAQESACIEKLFEPTRDSARSTFAATVQSFNPRRQLPVSFAELFADGVHQELKLPQPLVLPVFEADSIAPLASPTEKKWLAVPSMSVVFGVTLDAGKIVRVRRIAGSSSATFDVAVMSALARLDSSGALPPLPDTLGPAPLEISLAIGRVPLRTVHRLITNPLEAVVPLFFARSPAHAVSRSVGRGVDFLAYVPQPPTKRPDEAVIVRVLVQPDGDVQQESMQVLAYSSADYIRNVFEMIPNWHFVPMQVGSCAVPALEDLTFAPGLNASRKP
jgi:TonB C terminal